MYRGRTVNFPWNGSVKLVISIRHNVNLFTIDGRILLRNGTVMAFINQRISSPAIGSSHTLYAVLAAGVS